MRPVTLLPRLALAALVLSATPRGAEAQDRPGLRIVGPGDEVRVVGMERRHGYAALPATELTALGWTVREGDGIWELDHPSGAEVRLHAGTPFFRWGGDLLQLAAEPYLVDGRLFVPAQLATDFLPARLPALYAAAAAGIRLVEDSVARTRSGAADPGGAEVRPRAGEEEDARPRVVIIDPGHGGRDSGAWGPGGAREKNVALGVALALERALARYPGLEVHLTRRTDTLVPIWKRGEWATRTKGERPGVFLSIHANALPGARSTRGFETYFLSEARTDHERRVVANENAPLELENGDGPAADDADMDFILKELRNLDHPHWSELLAEFIQKRVDPVHPGPNRGVKQGPFAVITNALMPAVLVETGFISNAAEARLLSDAAFQEKLGAAIAQAVVDFFERYPPGRGRDLRDSGTARR
ncbi:MAG: N-acetylmuramoyl-L-alanine amidase [Gemmatimonadota bacterium]